MSARAGSYSMWRVYEVEGIDGVDPSGDLFRVAPGALEVAGVVAMTGIEAIAKVRVEHAPARRVWLYAATCGRRATKSNPNGALVAPLGRAEA